MTRHCDNQDCKYLYEGECIQSWWCIAGVSKCPEYKNLLKTPDDLYNSFTKKSVKDKDEE